MRELRRNLTGERENVDDEQRKLFLGYGKGWTKFLEVPGLMDGKKQTFDKQSLMNMEKEPALRSLQL